MSSSFEQGTDRHLLAIATPHACIPADSFRKKFKSHLESQELRAVGVNPIEFTADSLKLGGQKCLISGVVSPDFTKNPTHPTPISVGNSQFPTCYSRKRTIHSAYSNSIPKFGAPINPKVSVIQATGKAPKVPAEAVGKAVPSAAVEKPPTVPIVPTVVASKRETIQEFRNHWAQVQAKILNDISQPDPVETSVESPPIQNSGSSQKSGILDRIKACGSISIYKVSQGSPIEDALQSPVFRRITKRKSLMNKTTSNHAMPPIKKNPTPQMFDEPLPLD